MATPVDPSNPLAPQPHAHAQPVGPIRLGNWNLKPNRTHSEPERWICIYPAYINANKTRQEGRIIAKDKCVKNPNYMEIREALSAAGFSPIVENKQYPRERSRELEFRGRIRVQLKTDDGELFLEQFPTRESILVHLCEQIPKLKSRIQRENQEKQMQQQQQQQQSQQQSQQQAKKGKKGKK